MKKFALLAPLAACLAAPVMAEEEQVIDPADVTKVYTQSALMFSGNSQFQWQGQIAGGLENGQQFALLSEATFDNNDNDPNKFGFDYQNSRTQYFHVFNTSSAAMPKIGASLDYVNTRTNTIKNDLLSIGAVAAINPAYTAGLLVFPRAGVMTGSMEVAGMDSKDDLTGYSLGLITAKYLGENGAYLSIVPEWQDLSGDEIDMQNLSVKASINVPLNNSRTWWLNTRYDFTKSDLKVNGTDLGGDWETQAWIGVRHYF
ncbi:hypothetical protein [Photobacterium minamisatsumaniensis]|uniref:hypothetical protein n=1 Tax=Photobacterium minamisatsumaniensis TaxID=2910233 RepID=UPI003D0CA8EA